MATTTRTSTYNVYGAASWTGSATNQQIGGTPTVFHVQETFGGVAAINKLGKITGLSCVLTKVSANAMNGKLYVTTDGVNVVGNNVTTTGTYIGTWSATSSTAAQTITVGDFRGDAFKAAIGSATTWYIIWAPSAGMVLRYLMVKSYHPVWTISYEPNSISMNISGVWRHGEPWVNVGGTWRQGNSYINIGGVWRQGTS